MSTNEFTYQYTSAGVRFTFFDTVGAAERYADAHPGSIRFGLTVQEAV